MQSGLNLCTHTMGSFYVLEGQQDYGTRLYDPEVGVHEMSLIRWLRCIVDGLLIVMHMIVPLQSPALYYAYFTIKYLV